MPETWVVHTICILSELFTQNVHLSSMCGFYFSLFMHVVSGVLLHFHPEQNFKPLTIIYNHYMREVTDDEKGTMHFYSKQIFSSGNFLLVCLY